LHETGVDALGKAFMMLDQRSVQMHGCGLHMVDHLHCMGVAHRYYRHPGSSSVDVQRPQHVGAFLPAMQSTGVEGHAFRFKDGGAHVDRDAAIGFQFWFDHAGHGFDLDGALVGQAFIRDELDEGARAVATLLDFAPVSIVDTVAEIDAGRARSLNDQHLVGADTEAAIGQLLPLLGGEIDVLVNGVDDHEVIAGAMHFGEFEFHQDLLDTVVFSGEIR
jgi:hypothetical protein